MAVSSDEGAEKDRVSFGEVYDLYFFRSCQLSRRLSSMKRRGFVKLCASAVAAITASPELLARGHNVYQRYAKVALVDPYSHQPVRASTLDVGETYRFTIRSFRPRVF